PGRENRGGCMMLAWRLAVLVSARVQARASGRHAGICEKTSRRMPTVLAVRSRWPTRYAKRPLRGVVANLAERGGFEPPRRYKRLPDFESGTFNRSATSPDFPGAAGRDRGRNDKGHRRGGQGEGGTLGAVFPAVKGPCPKSPFPCRSVSCSTRSPSCRSSPSGCPTRPSWPTSTTSWQRWSG